MALICLNLPSYIWIKDFSSFRENSSHRFHGIQRAYPEEAAAHLARSAKLQVCSGPLARERVRADLAQPLPFRDVAQTRAGCVVMF